MDIYRQMSAQLFVSCTLYLLVQHEGNSRQASSGVCDISLRDKHPNQREFPVEWSEMDLDRMSCFESATLFRHLSTIPRVNETQ